jgi:hypothetical protein
MRRASALPLVLGTLAVAAGVAFLWDVGALPAMASRNVAAYVLGLLLGWASHAMCRKKYGEEVLFALATATLALVLAAGITVDGVRRWIAIGPLNVQPALFLAPLLLAIAASRDSRHWRAFILLPMALVASQPDAATTVAMAAGVAALMASASRDSRHGWSRRRSLTAAGALGFAAIGLLVAGIRTPPPVAFVEGTVGIARLSGTTAVILHLACIGLMVTALLSRRNPAGAALAAYFGVAALGATFWAFPMPVIGAGPSHLVGFGLAIGWLASIPSGDGPRRSNAG